MKVEINKAREICEVVRKNFPYDSPWKQYKVTYQRLLKSSQTEHLTKDVVELHREISKNKRNLDIIRDRYQLLTKTPYQYFEELVKSILKYQSQNCGETARLGYLVSRINGVKNSDVTINSLYAQTIYTEEDKENMIPLLDRFLTPLISFEYGGDLNIVDHVVTKINGEKKQTLIIDPLLNEVGTIKNMERLYTQKYRGLFDVDSNEAIVFKEYLSPPYPALPTITDDEAKNLGKKYQFLVLDENKDIINDVKKHFFGF